VASRVFYGLYPGIVKDNCGVLGRPWLGRVKVDVPQVYGKDVKDEDLPWAFPCFPYGGGVVEKENKETGEVEEVSYGMIAIPPIGSKVWVMFVLGDPERPVWMGHWFGVHSVRDDSGAEREETEIGVEAQSDSPLEGGSGNVARSPEGYPNILVIKNPASTKGMWVRWLGEERLEIVFAENENYIELDSRQSRIYVRATGWDVTVEAKEKKEEGEVEGEGGTIRLIGKNVEIQAEERVAIEGAKGITITSLQEEIGEEGGTVEINGSQEVMVRSETAIRGSSYHASGFDRH